VIIEFNHPLNRVNEGGVAAGMIGVTGFSIQGQVTKAWQSIFTAFSAL